MFLMSRKIKALGVKMVLSGEGSDEIFGGYLYFHKAPNKEELHKETCRKVCIFSLFLFMSSQQERLDFLHVIVVFRGETHADDLIPRSSVSD